MALNEQLCCFVETFPKSVNFIKTATIENLPVKEQLNPFEIME